MATILVTGITGAVMQPFAAALLRAGHTVVALVRSPKGTDPRTRVAQLLKHMTEEQKERLHVLAGDITAPMAGVSPKDFAGWLGKIDTVFHGAASIKFEETPGSTEIWETNVKGTEAMLALAHGLQIPEFRYMSTAYVAGDAKEFAENELLAGQAPQNSYEKSKIAAELLVRNSYPDRYMTLRIPIVIGDSATGEISSFSGYYGYFASFWQLRQSILQKWEKNPEGCEKAGVLVKDGAIAIPLWVPATLTGPLNVVPIDWVVRMMLRLTAVPGRGQTFHLTNPHPPTVKDTITESLKHLGFRGIRVVAWEEQKSQPPASGFVAALQRGICRGVQPFRPFTSKELEIFSQDQARAVLGEQWEDPPLIDGSLYHRLLEYACRMNFGRA